MFLVYSGGGGHGPCLLWWGGWELQSFLIQNCFFSLNNFHDINHRALVLSDGQLNFPCIVDYHSKCPVIKKMEDLSADSLILTCKIIFSEYGLVMKIMSGADGNFISDKFQRFCKTLNIEQAVSSSYHHQSNGQVAACIRFIKHTIKMHWY